MMGRAIGFIRLMRPINCLMMGFAVIVGASLVIAEPYQTQIALKLILGFITAFTFTGASMAINDYYDRDIDRINAPDHPIPSGLVTPNESLILAATLTIIGLIAAIMTNPQCLTIAILAWTVMILYNTRGKKTGLPGNMLVSLCVAIPFIYGSLLVGGDLKPTSAIFALLAFLSNTGREITKGIVDVLGDRSKNIMTIAVAYGEKAAAYIAALFYLSAVSLSIIPPLMGFVSIWFIPPVIMADIGFTASSILLIKKPTRENAKKIKNLALIWMMMGLIAFIIGKQT